MPRSKDLPSIISRSIAEDVLVGSERITDRRKLRYAPNRERVFVFTDGRRSGLGIGFQTPYFTVLPSGADVDMFWAGRDADKTEVKPALAERLQKEVATGHDNVVLLVGGEHVHPSITGAVHDAEKGELEKYGGYDLARDIVGLELLNLAEAKHLPVIAICRGSQLAINYFSERLAIPEDHSQEDHTFIPSPDGPILRQHVVKDVLLADLRNSLNIQPPLVTEVNSAHAQGYRQCDITPEAMAKLNANGWYPWLIADVLGVEPEEQVIEAWIRTRDNKVIGAMAQFHPERQNDGNGTRVREFMQEVIVANKRIQTRRLHAAS